jgi:hypothetical protein
LTRLSHVLAFSSLESRPWNSFSSENAERRGRVTSVPAEPTTALDTAAAPVGDSSSKSNRSFGSTSRVEHHVLRRDGECELTDSMATSSSSCGGSVAGVGGMDTAGVGGMFSTVDCISLMMAASSALGMAPSAGASALSRGDRTGCSGRSLIGQRSTLSIGSRLLRGQWSTLRHPIGRLDTAVRAHA